MSTGLFGIKVGMGQTFEKGKPISYTAILVTSNIVSQVKTKEKEGYNACQLAFQECREKVLNKPLLGHLTKNKLSPYRHLREVRGMVGVKVGSLLDVSLFQKGERIKITGISKGKGFAGVIKRHNFARGATSHGGGPVHRSIGSAGGGRGTRQKVPKGKNMPGHLGNKQVSISNLLVLEVFPEKHLILVEGSIPGNKKSLVKLCKTQTKSGINEKRIESI
jgi:large subunit ribosomal protein L3